MAYQTASQLEDGNAVLRRGACTKRTELQVCLSFRWSHWGEMNQAQS